MISIFQYMWYIEYKTAIKKLLINVLIYTLEIIYFYIGNKYQALDRENSIFIFIFVTIISIFINFDFVLNIFEKIFETRYDRFIASTSIGYGKLIFSLILSSFIINIIGYLINIIIIIVINSVLFEWDIKNILNIISMIYYLFIIYNISIIPIFTYFRDKKISRLILATVVIIVRLIINDQLYDYCLSYSYIIIYAVLLMGIILLISWKTAKKLWKRGI